MMALAQNEITSSLMRLLTTRETALLQFLFAYLSHFLDIETLTFFRFFLSFAIIFGWFTSHESGSKVGQSFADS